MSLKLDWCSHEAAEFAVMNWHYSKRMPIGRMVRIGVWEDKKYIGCVLFARGASNMLGHAFGLDQSQVCELVRVALNKHNAPVSKIGAIALRLLAKQCPGIKIVVSYADDREGHHGGIYQAMNWVYMGKTPDSKEWFHEGRWKHNREMTSGAFGGKHRTPNYKQCPFRIAPGKYKYVYALDNELRDSIKKLAKPYPKRTMRAAGVDSDTPDIQSVVGGANPTAALQYREAGNGTTD